MIYLNCAATAFKRPDCVVEAVSQGLCGVGSSGRGASATELASARVVFEAREALASILGFSHPDRICFTLNATQALNMAILGFVRPYDHVVATDWDHNSVLRPLHRLEDEYNVSVDYVRADTSGNLIMEDFSRLISDDTRLVCVTHQSNLTGNICDLKKIAQIVHEKGSYLLVDAAQSAGAMNIDMDEISIDILCFTGHKALFGPQGTGGIAVGPDIDIRTTFEGGTGILSFERRQPDIYPEHLEAGTLNTHGICGLCASARWILDKGLDTFMSHDAKLLEMFLDETQDIPGLERYGNFSADHGSILCVNLHDLPSSSLADKLSYEYGIATRPGAHCAPRMHYALGTQDKGAVRFSWNWFTDATDIHEASLALRQIAQL